MVNNNTDFAKQSLGMGNSSSPPPTYNCYGGNLSKNYITTEYWYGHIISQAFEDGSLANGAAILFLFLIGLPANIILIASILYKRLYKNLTHILLLNLGISDLLVCILVMPPTIIASFSGGYIFGDSDYTKCQVCQTGLIYVALTVFAVNILGVISLDRFIFIKFPFSYSKVVTLRRIIITVSILWIFSIFQSILPLFGFGAIKYAISFSTCAPSFYGETRSVSNIYYAVFLTALATTPVVVTIVTNVWIACIVRKQVRKVYATRRKYGNSDNTLQHQQSMKIIHKKRNKKQLVLVRIFGAIVVANLISWIPIILHTLMSLVVDLDLIPLGMYIFVYVSFLSHSVLHPIIESCFIPEIKAVYKEIFNVLFCKRLWRKKQGLDQSTIEGDLSLELKDQKASCCSHVCCDVFTIAVTPEPITTKL